MLLSALRAMENFIKNWLNYMLNSSDRNFYPFYDAQTTTLCRRHWKFVNGKVFIPKWSIYLGVWAALSRLLI